jgi:DNA-binding response OmpR family regulator
MNCKLLLIDDELSFTNAISDLLSLYGFEVRVAKSGKEGLLELPAFQPQIVITDILMNEMDGIEFIMNARRLQKGLKIIAMSGGGKCVSGVDYLETAVFFTADATILKPFRVTELVMEIMKLLK